MRHHSPTIRRLRSISLTLSVSAALWLPPIVSAQTPAKPKAHPPAPAKVDPAVEQLVEAHNKERAKEKLPPLKLEARLTEAAQVQAKDMAEHSMMSHEGSDGSTPNQRVVNAGYQYLRTGENVAVGYKDVDDVVLGWMESPGHRKNIMGDYTEMGAARVLGKEDKPYWCVTFGTPMPKLDAANAAKDLVKQLNDEREKEKLPALAIDEKLAKVAQERATDLAKKKSQGGGTAGFDGIDQDQYSELAMSTANGHPDAQAMLKVLLGNDNLKTQVLSKTFSKVGIGYATAEDGVPYWCVILGKPATPAKAKAKSRR
jgi:uncharacterized protein YkwD